MDQRADPTPAALHRRRLVQLIEMTITMLLAGLAIGGPGIAVSQ